MLNGLICIHGEGGEAMEMEVGEDCERLRQQAKKKKKKTAFPL